MSITKTTLASGDYINSVSAISSPSTALNYAPAVEGVVMGSSVVAGHRIVRPGVFTQGTPSEGSITQYSSNA